uniref:NADH-ubiquinone oxidoreductase chain 4 n=1 Tax=Metorchis orientalis TaxID=674132 RepID=A0A0M5KGZ8_9TREM|nr:NADH dehydrogenase subunit 4 [Metorchis orientalis]ALD61610.1 NADH dehydrogenase subunit 4 [Metorchis orientalis]
MSFKSVSWYSGLVGFVFIGSLWLVVYHFLFLQSLFVGVCLVFGGVFCFDMVGFYLVLLSVLLCISLLFWWEGINFVSGFMIGLSLVSSLLCYCCVNVVWFWIFYEMSIVPLLVLLVLESPYSERYIASWYFLGYVVFTSLPMLLCFCYLAVDAGSFDLRVWGSVSAVGLVSSVVLSVMFITKIPLFPFHVWLPIVHAEASSPVSVCLSGYIMKLGVLGVCRFCSEVLPNLVFSPYYILLCFFFAFLFFFSASRELDGKRWLAFMSLCHILIAVGCLCVGDHLLGGVSFIYCLGHGISAGVTFLFLWLSYEVCGTRNLFLLKSAVSGSLFLRILASFCLCTVCSLPVTVQFFCEVLFLGEAFTKSVLFGVVLFLNLFFGGLVPLFLMAVVLTRHWDINYGGRYAGSGVASLWFLVVWSFTLFLVV